jgi:hypothetical protein
MGGIFFADGCRIGTLMRIFLCCILMLFFSCAAFAANTPEQAVRDAQRAIDAKNADRFDQLVDAGRILGTATDLLLAEADKPNGQLPPILALMLSSVKDSQSLAGLRALIAQEIHIFVRYGVLSGNFAGKPDQSVRPGGILAPLFGNVSMGRKELHIAGPAAPGPRDQVFLPVELKDYGNDNTYPLLLRLQWNSPDWRIVEIVNLPDIWNAIQIEAKTQ